MLLISIMSFLSHRRIAAVKRLAAPKGRPTTTVARWAPCHRMRAKVRLSCIGSKGIGKLDPLAETCKEPHL
ncbi:hypothetical protein [Pleomorphomonas sp. T1.2MG-36]|uniref:hypothetical protein n=1 Tax=Pleomorphomonas sp. T1.2MG-36 TaxID=3041167 RepID=UPI002540F805|nr:hypothetical protein [Pleomorphomonas sp. T1.2MG-36]